MKGSRFCLSGPLPARPVLLLLLLLLATGLAGCLSQPQAPAPDQASSRSTEQSVPGVESGYRAILAPGENTALVLYLNGFKSAVQQDSDDGQRTTYRTDNPQNGLQLEVSLINQGVEGEAARAREYFLQQATTANVTMSNLQSRESGQLALYSYDDSVGQGTRHVHACGVLGTRYVDVHLWMPAYDDSKSGIFDDFIARIRLAADYQPTENEYTLRGNEFYAAGNYKQAANSYEKALAMEKTKQWRVMDNWRSLVNQLALSYAMGGDYARAEAVYQYGLTEDFYPLFYYNLACIYAETGDKTRALENLELAYQHKSEMSGGQSLPNPLKDSSFKALAGDADFQALVQRNAASPGTPGDATR